MSEFGRFGGRLNTRDVPDNPWISFMELRARQTIETVANSMDIDFAVTESTEIQAVAVSGSPSKVLMTFGMMDAMCRLANLLVSAGIFVDFGDTEPSWAPELENSVVPARDQILDEPFKWHSAYTPWMEDGERQVIFAYLLISMSRFVLLHEIGHIGYGHSRQSPEQPALLSAIIDGDPTDEEDRRAAIISQAKEIAADGFAFRTHLKLQGAEFSISPLDPMRQLLADKLIGTPRLQLRWTLLSAYLVFQILDRRTWSVEKARLATHPPAPFRIKSLYAAALNLKLPDLPESEIIEEISAAQALGSAVLDVGLKRFPDMFWLNRVSGEVFDKMFLDIYGELHHWTVWSGE